MYQIRRLPNGIPYANRDSFEAAKKEADNLCNSFNREVHYEVLKVESVYVTSYLDEAIGKE